VTGRPRPDADPVAAADLRDLLDTGLRTSVGTALPVRSDAGPTGPSAAGGDGRLIVTKERLTRALSCPVHRTVERFGERAFTLPLACGALIDVLFRQTVTVGGVGDPMADALDGLGMDERQASLVAWIADLAPAEFAELRSEVERQARDLVDRWPTLRASWLPRTHESMRVLLASGTVELSARVDLAIGPPADGGASVALVEVTSGARRPEHRDDLRFAALVEALRSPAPPFAVATYYTRTGEIDVEPVTHELLVDAAGRCLAGARVLAGLATAPEDAARCAACATLPPRAGTTRLAAPSEAMPAGGAPVVILTQGQAA